MIFDIWLYDKWYLNVCILLYYILSYNIIWSWSDMVLWLHPVVDHLANINGYIIVTLPCCVANPRSERFGVPQTRSRIYVLMYQTHLLQGGQLDGFFHLVHAVLPAAISESSSVAQVREYVRYVRGDDITCCPTSKEHWPYSVKFSIFLIDNGRYLSECFLMWCENSWKRFFEFLNTQVSHMSHVCHMSFGLWDVTSGWAYPNHTPQLRTWNFSMGRPGEPRIGIAHWRREFYDWLFFSRVGKRLIRSGKATNRPQSNKNLRDFDNRVFFGSSDGFWRNVLCDFINSSGDFINSPKRKAPFK